MIAVMSEEAGTHQDATSQLKQAGDARGSWATCCRAAPLAWKGFAAASPKQRVEEALRQHV